MADRELSWRESWLPQDAEPEPPEECKVAPCTGFRCCCSPMFFVVIGIVGINYGPYVLWLPHNSIWSWFCVVVFHLLIALLLGSYVMCVFTDPGTTPPRWHRLVASDQRLRSEFQFCRRSSMYRPVRSHFCSITRRVVLNMVRCASRLVSVHRFHCAISSHTLTSLRRREWCQSLPNHRTISVHG